MDNKTSRVLIVDDMLANRIILSSLLASKGVTSDQVESRKECIELCKKTTMTSFFSTTECLTLMVSIPLSG